MALSTNFTDATIPSDATIDAVYAGPVSTVWASGVSGGTRYTYRSLNNGSTWKSSTVFGKAVSSFWQEGTVVFVGVSESGSDAGVWVSTDSGESFSKIIQTAFPIFAFQEFNGSVYAGGDSFYQLDKSGGFIGVASLDTAGYPTTIHGMANLSDQLILTTSLGVFKYNSGGNSKLIDAGNFLGVASNSSVVAVSAVPPNSALDGVFVGDIGSLKNSSLYAPGTPFASLAYGGIFVGAGQNGAHDQDDWGLWYSTSGTTWTRSTVTSFAYAVSYGNGFYLAGVTGGVYKSPDGSNWTCLSCPPPLPTPIITPVVTPSATPASASANLKHPLILIHGIGGVFTDWDDIGFTGFLKGFGFDEISIRRFSYGKINDKYDYQGDIAQIGSNLPLDIEGASSDFISRGGDGKVDVLGFSMGGVVGRQGLLLSPSATAKVRKFIEVGVPNLGSFMASLFVQNTTGKTDPNSPNNLFSQVGNWLINQVINHYRSGNQPIDANSPAVQELRSGSSYLKALNSQSLDPSSSLKAYDLFGDERIVLHQKIFFLDLYKEFSFGDFVVSTSSAATLPGFPPSLQFAYQDKPQIDVHLSRGEFASEYKFIGDPTATKYFHDNLLKQPDIRDKIKEILSNP